MTLRTKILLVTALAALLVAVVKAQGETVVTDFLPSTNNVAEGVIRYNLYGQPLNAPDVNRWFWIAETKGTNFVWDTANVPNSGGRCPNPVLLCATASTATNESGHGEIELVDTNSLPQPIVVTPNHLPTPPGKTRTHRP